MNARSAAILAVAAVLAAAVAAELASDAGRRDVGTAPNPTTVSSPAMSATRQPLSRTEFAAAILARPLFATDRRPPTTAGAETGIPVADASLPRLAGIVTGGGARFAIFQPTDAAYPIVVGEKDKIIGRTVVGIGPAEVVLRDVDGDVHLHPLPTGGAERMAITAIEPVLPPPNPNRRIVPPSVPVNAAKP